MLQNKVRRVNLRVQSDLLDAIDQRREMLGISRTDLINLALMKEFGDEPKLIALFREGAHAR